MIGDEDSSCKARIRQNANPDIQKWSDKNHVLRTLGKILHQSKHFEFGAGNNRLNDTVIEYVLSCFGAAFTKNKGDAKGLQKSLEAMVPYLFGSHDLCGKWCGFKENPKSYKHKNLPVGNDLVGSGLKAFLEETLKPYMTDEAVDKLYPLGSTQRNESLNGVIGSKNPKTRFYGVSESSDFRTAAAVAQFNDKYSYLLAVSEELRHKTSEDILKKYALKYNLRREKQANRQSTLQFKINRKRNRAKMKQTNKLKEMQEGTTYDSGVGFRRNSILVQDILANPEESNDVKEWLDGRCEKFDRKFRYERPNPAVPITVLLYDLETGGLKKDAEVLQVSISAASSSDHPSETSLYVLPTKKIDSAATKVHGLSVSYATGQKALVDKDSKLFPSTSLQKAAEEVSQFLYKMKSNNEQLLLVAHNGHTFDHNRFLNFIHEASGSEYLDESSTFFGDGLPAFRKVFKDKSKSFKSFKLVDVYKIIFPNDTFKADDALADTKALRKVCSESIYSDRIFKEIVSN